MSFEEFQNRARLYVIGALENGECREFEETRRQFGEKAEDFITEAARRSLVEAPDSRLYSSGIDGAPHSISRRMNSCRNP